MASRHVATAPRNDSAHMIGFNHLLLLQTPGPQYAMGHLRKVHALNF